jgi:hypothetical protein
MGGACTLLDGGRNWPWCRLRTAGIFTGKIDPAQTQGADNERHAANGELIGYSINSLI